MNSLKRARCAGMTLVEVMFTLTIAAILIAIAVPGFNKQIAASAKRSVVADFITAMAYARAESVKRGDDVYLRSISNNESWNAGWCVTTGANCSGSVIRRFEGFDAVTLKSTDQSTSSFTFDSQGFLASSSVSVSICSSNTHGKKITVTPLGQALAQDCTCTNNSICG